MTRKRYHHAEKKLLATQRDTVTGAKVQFIGRSCPEKTSSFWGKSSPAADCPAWGKSSGDGVEERGDGATIVDVAEKEDGGVGVHEEADEDVAAVSAEGEDDGSGVNRKWDAAPHESKAKEAGSSTMVSMTEAEVARNKDMTTAEDVGMVTSPRMTMVQRGNAVAAGNDIMAGPWVPEEPTEAPHEVIMAGRGVLPSEMSEVVRREEQQRRERAAADTGGEEEPVDVATTAAVTAQPPVRPIAAQTSTELLLLEQRYQQQLPDQLEEKGSLAEMRAERLGMTTARKRSRQAAGHKYQYEQQGRYEDTELRDNGGGKTLRMAQLRAATAGNPSCLPTTLLALTKTHTQEVRLATCAQFSVDGIDLKQYGRHLKREAPVEIVEGFGGGTSRVLGVWRFTGTTQFQQRITVDALLVDGEGDEFLVGEHWMLEKQAKMDFSKRELKYRDTSGQKIILPFTCHGISTLPKNRDKRHLMMAPTVGTVRNGTVPRAVLNVEGRREKLLARGALGKWIPADAGMEILSMNGEFERARVAE
ncbi:unnamed protein product [Phytophthora fragariaefolia]|uniref:Unnamed protein product n=1 Tax=Phytophthora fragariaefolia TaxID=1490495 RepID=A0A9W6XAU3_9STRA|nr:unnamed protein product [Phytophthora fragariaefolia]